MGAGLRRRRAPLSYQGRVGLLLVDRSERRPEGSLRDRSTPRLDDVMRALDEADTIARTPSNGVRISGRLHNVTLFSQ